MLNLGHAQPLIIHTPDRSGKKKAGNLLKTVGVKNLVASVDICQF
jgi:hypothetical protein